MTKKNARIILKNLIGEAIELIKQNPQGLTTMQILLKLKYEVTAKRIQFLKNQLPQYGVKVTAFGRFYID